MQRVLVRYKEVKEFNLCCLSPRSPSVRGGNLLARLRNNDAACSYVHRSAQESVPPLSAKFQRT